MIESDGEKLNRLILAVADGNAECLDGVYEIAGGRMFAVALVIVGRDNAEDVLHESFIKVARFAKKYGRGTNPYGWLCKIVKNTALDFLRTKKARPETDIDGLFNLTSLDYSPEARENAIALEQALSRLSKDEKKIIYYTYYLDMTVREIAAELKIGKSAVQRAKDKAEKKLKTLLDGGTKD